MEALLVTCDDNNVGSARVIERCGEVLESIDVAEDGTVLDVIGSNAPSRCLGGERGTNGLPSRLTMDPEECRPRLAGSLAVGVKALVVAPTRCVVPVMIENHRGRLAPLWRVPLLKS